MASPLPSASLMTLPMRAFPHFELAPYRRLPERATRAATGCCVWRAGAARARPSSPSRLAAPAPARPARLPQSRSSESHSTWAKLLQMVERFGGSSGDVRCGGAAAGPPTRARGHRDGRHGLCEGQFRTLAEVAALFDLTRERSRKIEAKARHKLRVASGGCASLCGLRGGGNRRSPPQGRDAEWSGHSVAQAAPGAATWLAVSALRAVERAPASRGTRGAVQRPTAARRRGPPGAQGAMAAVARRARLLLRRTTARQPGIKPMTCGATRGAARRWRPSRARSGPRAQTPLRAPAGRAEARACHRCLSRSISVVGRA